MTVLGGLTVVTGVGATMAGVALALLTFMGVDAWVDKVAGHPSGYDWWERTRWEGRDSAGKTVVVAIGMAFALIVAIAGSLMVLGLVFAAIECGLGHCPDVPS